MEGQKLGNRSILGERHGPWLSHSLTHVSDTAANSQDGSSLEFVAAAAARECNIQDARGGGLCWRLLFLSGTIGQLLVEGIFTNGEVEAEPMIELYQSLAKSQALLHH